LPDATNTQEDDARSPDGEDGEDAKVDRNPDDAQHKVAESPAVELLGDFQDGWTS